MDFDEAIKKINPNEDYSIQQTAEFFGLSYSAIRGHVNRKNIPARLILGRYFIKGADILNKFAR